MTPLDLFLGGIALILGLGTGFILLMFLIALVNAIFS